jgi:hypothetical protein
MNMRALIAAVPLLVPRPNPPDTIDRLAVQIDAKLVARMVPLLKREFGDPQVVEAPAWTASEDFAYFAQRAGILLLARRHAA